MPNGKNWSWQYSSWYSACDSFRKPSNWLCNQIRRGFAWERHHDRTLEIMGPHYWAIWYILGWFPEEILTKSKNSQVVNHREATSRIQVQLLLMTLDLAKWKQGVNRLYLRRSCASDCTMKTLFHLMSCIVSVNMLDTLERPALLGRIIARPYVGEPGNFSRTANRHDHVVSPFEATSSTNW